MRAPDYESNSLCINRTIDIVVKLFDSFDRSINLSLEMNEGKHD